VIIMQNLTAAEFVIRLGVGLGCGALIGVERQWRARMAGLRTNALVATGATLFVLYSVSVHDVGNSTRVASYVVSGIGFLGGGVILRDGFNVRGLNTAATLWCSAAVGCLAADGQLLFALLAALTVLAVHLFGRPLGRLLDQEATGEEDEDLRPYELKLRCATAIEDHIRALLVQQTSGGEVMLRGLKARRDEESRTTSMRARLLLDGDAPARMEKLVARMLIEPGVTSIDWERTESPPPAEPVPLRAAHEEEA
jgi:putative Mg2+ transporter-C (MgtC) family protein